MCKNTEVVIKMFDAIHAEIGYAATSRLFKEVIVNRRSKMVCKLANKGYTDAQISTLANVSMSVIQRETTHYWEGKMKRKKH